MVSTSYIRGGGGLAGARKLQKSESKVVEMFFSLGHTNTFGNGNLVAGFACRSGAICIL